MRGVFVTGTDTGVGKTVVSAALLHRYGPSVRYWKPIQTGIEYDDDTAEVQRLTGCGPGRVVDAGVRLPRRLSPHLAARLAGVTLDLASLAASAGAWVGEGTCIVEGAGGVLVPLDEQALLVDLVGRYRLPVVVVARSGLGTINHTLLTIEALERRAVAVAGVVMVGPLNPDNRLAIEHYSRIPVLGELPPLDPLTPAALGGWAAQALDVAGRLAEHLT